MSTRFRRLATASAFASLFTYSVIMTIAPSAINEIETTFSVSKVQLAWIPLLFMLGFFASVMAGGHYADRKGKLPVLTLGAIFMGAGAIVSGWSPSYTILCVGLVVMGLGGGMSEGVSMAVVTDVFDPDRRTAIMNLSQLVFAVGAVSAPMAVARLIATGLQWRWAFFGAAIVCIVTMMISFVAIACREERINAPQEHSSWQQVIRNPMVLWLSAGLLLYVGSEIGLASWLAAYFIELPQSNGVVAARSVALFWFGIGLGRFAVIWISRHVSDYILIISALALALICQIIMLLTHSVIASSLLVVAIGTSLAPIWPTIVSRAGSVLPAQTGTVLGIVVAFGGLGAALFPPIIGYVANSLGMRLALWTCVILISLNLTLFVRLKRRESGLHPKP